MASFPEYTPPLNLQRVPTRDDIDANPGIFTEIHLVIGELRLIIGEILIVRIIHDDPRIHDDTSYIEVLGETNTDITYSLVAFRPGPDNLYQVAKQEAMRHKRFYRVDLARIRQIKKRRRVPPEGEPDDLPIDFNRMQPGPGVHVIPPGGKKKSRKSRKNKGKKSKGKSRRRYR